MSTPIAGTTYPFDPTGQLASNLIPAEQQILTAQNYQDYHFIVPDFAPYFTESLTITYKDTDGNVRPLTEGVDYICTHVFHDASLACASPIAGSISFYNTMLTGQVQLKYQTLGGIWTIDLAAIAQILADRLHNPRITTWEQVTEQPVTFPVIDHEWNLVDLVGMSDVVTALNDISNMLAQTGSTGLAAHLADHNNPHLVTAAQVNLGNVQNFGIASTADAEAGVRNDVYMTPASVAAAISVLPSGGLAAHEADHTNPHVVTAAQVNLGNVQNYGVASTADAQAATRDDVYMTPLKTAALLSAGFGQDLANHEDDYTNPHRVTAQQVGAYTTQEIDNMLQGYLTTSGTAANSTELGGSTLAQVLQAAANQTAANSLLFGGQTPAAFTSSVLGGTAANSNQFGGYTPTQFLDLVQTSAPAGAIQSAQPTNASTATNLWTKLGYVLQPTAGNAATRLPDVQIFVSGGDSYNDSASGLYLITMSSRTATPTLTVLNLAGVATPAQFGWKAGVDSNSNPTWEIWVKTAGEVNFIISTELNPQGVVFTSNSGAVSTDPTGITFVVEDSFARASDVANGLQAMATAFENFKSAAAAA